MVKIELGRYSELLDKHIERDTFLEKYLKAIESSQNEDEILRILENLYNEGFEDGANSEKEEGVIVR
jgi:flagellar biosynthesis/type III secretory pathway protein FliH